MPATQRRMVTTAKRTSAAGLVATLLLVLASLVACTSPDEPPELTLSDGMVPATGGQTEAVLYLRIGNTGGADTIVGASSPGSEDAIMHRADFADGLVTMTPVDSIEVPNGELTLANGTSHIMLRGFEPALQVGDEVEVTLEFERSSDQVLELEVTTFDDAVDFLEDRS